MAEVEESTVPVEAPPAANIKQRRPAAVSAAPTVDERQRAKETGGVAIAETGGGVVTKEGIELSTSVGTKGAKEVAGRSDLSVMQKHVVFWDADGDGVIWPGDVYRGFRKLGYSWLFSVFAVFCINGTMSYPTSDSWIPDPFFRVRIKRTHNLKHSSDSQVYDWEGRFDNERFEQMFAKYDTDNKGGLTYRDLLRMIKELRHTRGSWVYGKMAAYIEWTATWLLLRDPKTGTVSKTHIRKMFDGTIFYDLADLNTRGKSTPERQHKSADRVWCERVGLEWSKTVPVYDGSDTTSSPLSVLKSVLWKSAVVSTALVLWYFSLTGSLLTHILKTWPLAVLIEVLGFGKPVEGQ